MTAFVGDILSATAASVTGDPTPSRTWAWLRGGSAISGQTASTYRVTQTDIGSSVSALQTETNFIGAASAASPPLAVSSWSPSLLFSASEPGIWLDPSDLTTMFQDRAGSTPVTAPGQSVGLRLDASQGLVLGPELVTNGTFDTDLTGWTNSNWTWSSGSAATTGVFGTLTQLVGSRTNSKLISIEYVKTSGRVQCQLIDSTAVNATISLGGAADLSTLGASPLSVVATAGYDTIRFVTTDATASWTIDNVSVKELPGNHARANADLERGIYGIEPLGGRRNLLTFTEQFDNAAWAKVSGGTGSLPVVTANAAIAPDGTMTADQVVFSTGAGTTSSDTSLINQSLTTSAVNYTGSFYARTTSGTATLVFRNAASASYGAIVVTDQWQRFERTELGPVGSGERFGLGIRQGLSGIGPINASATVLIWGAQLETGSTATAYQRVVDQYNVTEAGVTTLHYVQYDGSNDGYVTPTITPGTDKVQVFAGVRKLSDAATGMLIEHSSNLNTNNGAFWLGAPITAGTAQYQFNSKGTTASAASYTNAAVAAPVTSVLAGLGDISGDLVSLRANGSLVAQSANDQGTGNYLAYPLYIGRRGGLQIPFNGRDYGIIVRFGANLSTSNINRAEYYVAQKTGVTL